MRLLLRHVGPLAFTLVVWMRDEGRSSLHCLCLDWFGHSSSLFGCDSVNVQVSEAPCMWGLVLEKPWGSKYLLRRWDWGGCPGRVQVPYLSRYDWIPRETIDWLTGSSHFRPWSFQVLFPSFSSAFSIRGYSVGAMILSG